MSVEKQILVEKAKTSTKEAPKTNEQIGTSK